MRKITQQRLENIALFYLERYESSQARLKQVLLRRVARARKEGADLPDDVPVWINEVCAKMVRLGYINDTRYAENAWRTYSAAGKSVRWIVGKLKQAGIAEDIIAQCMDDDRSVLDAQAAALLVAKKKLGKYRPQDQQKAYAQKDLARLARAGFSYEIAQKALWSDD